MRSDSGLKVAEEEDEEVGIDIIDGPQGLRDDVLISGKIRWWKSGTNGPTDQATDTLRYRDARTNLKTVFSNRAFVISWNGMHSCIYILFTYYNSISKHLIELSSDTH